MDLKLEGKLAIVNGASQGIGYAAARALATDGAELLITGRKQVPLEQAAQRLRDETSAVVHTVPADIRSAQDCVKIVETAADRMGGVDILINNDGAPPLGDLASFDDEAWQKAVERNLYPVVRMVRGVIPHMQAHGGGSIVNVTSVTVLFPRKLYGLSVATWASVLGYSQTLALELGELGVRINTVCPGVFMSERRTDPAQRRGEDLSDARELGIALGRLGEHHEIGSVIAFLASPASGYVTGTTIPVDGGLRRGLI